MTILSKRTLVRKPKQLSLLEWADQKHRKAFDPLLVTRMRARRSGYSESHFNLLAELFGYTGRISDGGEF